MNRILFVATVDMFSRTGGGLAVRAYYNAISSLYPEQVDLMHAEDYIPVHCEISNLIPIKRISYSRWFLNLLTGHIHRFYPGLINYLRLNKNKYNCCIINGGTYAGDIIDDIKKMGIKVVVIHHNYEYEYVKANPSITSFWGLNINAVVQAEKNAYKKADVNLFLTQDDLNKFQEVYGECKSICRVIGCFELGETQLPELIKQPQESVIVISGALDFKQSISGIKQFFRKYFDIVKRLDPSIRVIITGRNPHQDLLEIQKANADTTMIIPNPEDIFSIIQRGSIFICPVYNGGGLKLRIMDGLRLGLPVLTHICSARGYEEFFNKPYFRVYQDEESFRKGFADLLVFCRSSQYNKEVIRNDYLQTFSFAAGKKRIGQSIDVYSPSIC